MTNRFLTHIPRTGRLEHLVLGKPFWITVSLMLLILFTLLTH